MSTTDKTRQQLMASMRKTKTTAAGQPAAGGKAPRPVSRTAKSTRKTAAGAAAKRSVKVAGGPRTGTLDSYQAGRRVWPD
jgi:hypothetical protein